MIPLRTTGDQPWSPDNDIEETSIGEQEDSEKDVVGDEDCDGASNTRARSQRQRGADKVVDANELGEYPRCIANDAD